MARIIGWDIGGVHLKAALAEDGRIVAAVQIASHLGYGLERLESAFATATAELGGADRHVLTMTGELADIFASRREGVTALADTAVNALSPSSIAFYAGRCGFVAADGVARHAADIASANWHATAALVARGNRDALLVDMGSTTTDVVPVVDGGIAARGYTDAERLAAGELVYTGLVRSHVLAVAQRAPMEGVLTPLMNEVFADMGDVYRMLGRLDPAVDLLETADGGDKSPAASWTRLSRNVGREPDEVRDGIRENLARWFAERQLRAIHDAAMQVLSAVDMPRGAPLVGAGIGLQVLRELARRMDRPFVGFHTLLDLSEVLREKASHIAPAAALALIATARQQSVSAAGPGQ